MIKNKNSQNCANNSNKKFEKHRVNHIGFVEKMCHACSGFEEKIEPWISRELADEMADMDKHEVLCSIASSLGSNPENFNKAEEIFEKIKYSLTEYVLRHEYNRESSLSVDITLWLENRKSPLAMQSLNTFIEDYLKPHSA